jgi:hypothetical protein
MHYTLISMFADPRGSRYYTEAGENLRKRCDELGIPHRIERRPNAGDWLKNTKLKGPFVHETLEDIQGPVLWVDVDCPVHRVPDLSGYERNDFAAVEFLSESKLTPPLKIMGTTLFFNWTDRARKLAKDWSDVCKDESRWEAGDHRLLSNLLYDADYLRWKFLPDSFCQHAKTRGNAPPVISLGLAKEVQSRTDILRDLHKQGLA